MSVIKEEVVLEIEGTPLKCNKRELINNSDYFKAMFEGNFAERNQSSIKLEGIDLKSMNIILTLLWDETYTIDDEEILLVLQTACMLQFERIRENCIERLTEMLVPDNSIKIWFMTEPLGLRPLCLKAKSLALTEFQTISESESLLELELPQLHTYLSNVDLQCNCELDVFNVCMKWFYEHCDIENSGDSSVSILLSLFTCVDFTGLSDSDIKEMMTFPDVNGNSFIIDMLNCFMDERNGVASEKYGAPVLSQVVRLSSGNRRTHQVARDPFFFVINPGEAITEYYYDSYNRRRKFIRLEMVEGGGTRLRNKYSAAMLIFNKKNCKFIHCIDMSEEKYSGHEGFHILGYKEQIFVFGGEVTLGSGNWNLNFWVYDTIRERWERKTKLPIGRRHFHSCICGNYLYIIGGTGSFRIIQDNMFWYNYKENIWSKQIMLPCSGIQIKCCNYKNQLFLLNISDRCGYLFIPVSCSFVTMNISDCDNLVANYPDQFALFAYENRIFLKGSSLIEMEIVDKELRIVNYRYLEPVNCDNMESVLCSDTVYTLYKYNHTKTITIETFSMRSYETTYLFQNLGEDSVVKVGQGKFSFGMHTKLFSLQHHYKMADEDVYVNKLEI